MFATFRLPFFRHLLFPLCIACALVAPLAAAPDFWLTATPTQAAKRDQGSQSFILRELARQAVILAALHEAGLTPGDEVFDAYPDEGALASPRIRLNAPWRAEQVSLKLELENNSAADAPALELTLSARGQPSARADDFARALAPALAGPVADWLRAHVQSAGSRPRSASTFSEADIRRLEASPDPIGCFALLRHWHGAAAEEGAALSPGTLAGLARAYILLGESTRHHWSALSSACAARALLYSALLQHRHPGHPLVAETRVWVLCLGGYHAAALCELDGLAARDSKPDWLPVIDAAARYRTPLLADIARSDQTWSPLAAWLTITSVENQETPDLYTRYLEEFSPLIPFNPRGVYVANHVLGINGRARATADGLNFAPLWLARNVPAIPALPAALLAPQKTPANTDLIRAFALACRAADDGSYPAWGALGRIVWDSHFAFAVDRLHFLANWWAVSTRDEAGAFRPAFVGHPHAAVLATLERGRTGDVFSPGSFEQVRLGDVVEGMDAYVIWAEGKSAAFADMPSATASDLLWFLSNDDIHSHRRLYLHGHDLARLRAVSDNLATSPFHPAVHADAIRLDTDWEARLSAARALLPDNPLIASAAGERLARDGRPGEAIPHLEFARRELRESSIYATLAEAHLASGDEAGWLATRLAINELPDTGLTHARNSVKISAHYLHTQRPALALPHAEQAAESCAGWAMDAAAIANAVAGNHQRARYWMERTSDRYGLKLANQISWHATAGYGERDELLARLLKDDSDRVTLPRDHELLASGRDDIVDRYLAIRQTTSDNYYLLLAGLAALEAGDAPRARELFTRLPAEFASDRVRDTTRVANHRLASLFLSDLDQPIDDETFTKRVDAILREQGLLHEPNARYAPDLLYFAARFLRIRERAASRPLLASAARHGVQPDLDRYVLPLIAREFSLHGDDLLSLYREPVEQSPPATPDLGRRTSAISQPASAL